MVKISFQPAVAGIKADKADKAAASGSASATAPAAEILLTPSRVRGTGSQVGGWDGDGGGVLGESRHSPVAARTRETPEPRAELGREVWKGWSIPSWERVLLGSFSKAAVESNAVLKWGHTQSL